MKILTLLLTLIFAVSASKGLQASLGDSVIKKNPDIVFSGSISYQYMLGARYSDSDDSDSTGAMNSDFGTNSASSMNSDEAINNTLPIHLSRAQVSDAGSLSLGGVGNSVLMNRYEKTNPYEGLPWADYPSSSDSGVSEGISSDDERGEEMVFTLPKFIQDQQKTELVHSLSLGERDNAGTMNSYDKTNPYEGLPWADYPSSSDSGVSEETSSDYVGSEEVITPTSVPDVERRDPDSRGFGGIIVPKAISRDREISSARSTAVSIQEDRPDSRGFGGIIVHKVISRDKEISSACSTSTSIQEDRPDYQGLRRAYSSRARDSYEATDSYLITPSITCEDSSDSYSNKAVYSSEHSEIDNTPISDEPIVSSEDRVNSSEHSDSYDVLVPDKSIALSADQINYSITQHMAYNQLFNIIYRMNETILTHPEYFLTNEDKIRLEYLESSANSAISGKTQVIRNVIDGIAVSCEEVKNLRRIIDNKSIDIETRLAIKNILKKREFNKYEKQILSRIRSLSPTQRKFLLSLIEAATGDVIAIPFNSGCTFDTSDTVENQTSNYADNNYNDSNIKEGFLVVNSRGNTPEDLKREPDKRSPAYNTADDSLVVNEAERRKIFLSYNNYCWINNQLFPKGIFNQELVKALCEVDEITDSDMLFAKLVRRLIKGFDLREAIRFICEGDDTYYRGLNIHYDEQESTLTPMEDVYTTREVFAVIQSMLYKHAEVIAKHQRDSVENLNQFQNRILQMMESDEIKEHVSRHHVLILRGCKLTEGLGEDDVRITVKACQDIMRVISSEVEVSPLTGLYQVIPDSIIARFATDVFNDVICAFKM